VNLSGRYSMQEEFQNIVAVIMAGGTGTRFWPLSTGDKPKQFLELFGERSLLRMSFERVAGPVPPERVLVLTNRAFTGLVADQLPELPRQNIVGEPQKKDTAAAVALAAALCKKRYGNPVMAVLTADHLIEPVDEFRAALLSAARGARESGALYTMGIPPEYPATGYGYLELGAKVDREGETPHHELKSFREKPDLETAKRYVDSGRYLWNSGMFVWTVGAVWKEIEGHLPDHAKAMAAAAEKDGAPGWEEALAEAFEKVRPVSIDFGVMEKASRVRCVAAGFEWSDVGGWLSLRSRLAQDGQGNAVRGEIFTLDASGNLVFCEDQAETVVLIGADDLVVVRSGGRTLVAHKDRLEDLKKVVEKMNR